HSPRLPYLLSDDSRADERENLCTTTGELAGGLSSPYFLDDPLRVNFLRCPARPRHETLARRHAAIAKGPLFMSGPFGFQPGVRTTLLFVALPAERRVGLGGVSSGRARRCGALFLCAL